MNLVKYREQRKRKILVDKLKDILVIFSTIETNLREYRYILPAKDVLNSVKENKTLIQVTMRKFEDENEPKKT